MKIKYRKYPEFVKTMANRHIEYNKTLDYINEQEKQGNIFVIRPDSKLPVSRIEKDPANLERAYRIGREIANRELMKLEEYMK